MPSWGAPEHPVGAEAPDKTGSGPEAEPGPTAGASPEKGAPTGEGGIQGDVTAHGAEQDLSSGAQPGAGIGSPRGSEPARPDWGQPATGWPGYPAGPDAQPRYGAPAYGQTWPQPGWPQAQPPYQWIYSEPPRPRAPRRPPRATPGWLGVALVAALVGALGGGGVVAVFASRAPKTIVREYFPSRGGKVHVGDVQSILASVLPAVVSIDTSDIRGTGNAGGYVQGAGTGMIIEPSGVILTNNHVIAGAATVTVAFFGQVRQFPARIIGVDAQKDIALVQVEGAGDSLPVVHFGNSGSAQQGDGVLAIGNALALAGGETVTEGIVSALNRSLTATTDGGTTENLTGLIQTDAPINPGNSGGPLVDAAGQVVAMNTAVATSSQGNAPAQNVGFAIAVDEIQSVAAQILHHPIRP
jgi:S1-C subfamily serine protease